MDKLAPTGAKNAQKASQIEREARALRANLRRRKQQAQAREDADLPEPAAADLSDEATDH